MFRLFCSTQLLLVAALRLPAPLGPVVRPWAARKDASVVFIVPESASALSPFGLTSPEPNPPWLAVAEHLAARLTSFDGRITASVIHEGDESYMSPGEFSKADIIIAVGCSGQKCARALTDRPVGVQRGSERPLVAFLAYDCAANVASLQAVDQYKGEERGLGQLLQAASATLIPWGRKARGRRLLNQASTLLKRHSSEDLLYALFFILHAYVLDIDLVQTSVNPSWEKGVLQNGAEFGKMIKTCGPTIAKALSDPTTKKAIDLLNQVDLRDQAGSYKVIVSFETPLLEDFSLCILQQNNCFNCDARIIEEPPVPPLTHWRGRALDAAAARQILVGHLAVPGALPPGEALPGGLPYSWKVVCGANPAYDAFPAQHQVFYPSTKSPSSLWYDPVFQVETVDGRRIWTKRHYRCTPRVSQNSPQHEKGATPGLWTFSTLDNGVVSKEHWTTVDAADDLSWAVLHYSGAAAAAGTSYLGALLCSADGGWPEGAATGAGRARIDDAFARCGLKPWELYGHGPPAPTEARARGESFMWPAATAAWEAAHPPPLERIGDMTVSAWRAKERAKNQDA